jgi:DNA repair protein RecO (recombination protein O)
MQTYRTEGIILQANNFQDYDQILTVFTLDEGIIKLFVKGANHFKRRSGTVTSPLTQLEIDYTRGKSEILKCKTLSVLNLNLKLRDSLTALEAGCEIIRAIQVSQQPNISTPDLYKLMNGYLEKIPTFSDPAILTTSFCLKVLRHDGLLGITPNDAICSLCTIPLAKYYVASGECFCSAHAPSGSLCFDQEEINLIVLLAYCRNFQQLSDIELTPDHIAKLKNFFMQTLMNN